MNSFHQQIGSDKNDFIRGDVECRRIIANGLDDMPGTNQAAAADLADKPKLTDLF